MFAFGEPKKAAAKKAPPKDIFGASLRGVVGYSCTLYKDYLVFFGGLNHGEFINSTSVYNLKEGEMETSQQGFKSIPFSVSGHSACLCESEKMIIFFGDQTQGGGLRFGVHDRNSAMLTLIDESDGLSWYVTHGVQGPNLPSPVCNFYEEKISLYAYQANGNNGNFGELHCYDFSRKRWRELRADCGDMRLRRPSQRAIWSQNKLYVFTENVEEKPRTTPFNGDFFEDVYVLDMNKKEKGALEWERVSFSGQAPCVICNISMTEANGIIYIFGSSYEEAGEKSVLWAYDTNAEKWNRIHDIGTLTARPNQKAVVYEGQLLIIDWDYDNQDVQIQYHSLSDAKFGSPSPSGSKDLCKDQAANFIQDAKNLYNSRLFPDVVFEVEGEEIPAHKALLAYRSNYFMKVFTSGMSESQSAKIPIPNMKAHIFKAILQYIYCNEVELDEQLALDLIPTVDEYVMKGLKGLCEKYLCKQLRKENVVDMLIVADRHEIEELKKACFKYILKNLGNIDENEEMMKLSKSLFIELLKFSTPSSQQKNNTKIEKKEEEKYNFGNREKKSTSKKAPAGFGFGSGPRTTPAMATTKKEEDSSSSEKSMSD